MGLFDGGKRLRAKERKNKKRKSGSGNSMKKRRV